MTRYFERFYWGVPMDELSESAALECGTYVVEEVSPIHRYRSILDGELRRIIYAGWTDPAEPRLDALRRSENAPIEVFSPVEQLPDGGHRYRTWYLDSTGHVTKILEPEIDRHGRRVRESLRDSHGELVSYNIHRYDTNGYLIDIVTHGPDGAVLATQDA